MTAGEQAVQRGQRRAGRQRTVRVERLPGPGLERELRTAQAIADGLGNPEIARRLGISIATVKAHTGNLFAELAVENRVQIALLIRDAGE